LMEWKRQKARRGAGENIMSWGSFFFSAFHHQQI
jgi:hypothetical protein